MITFIAATAPTLFLDVGTRFAYRHFGSPAGTTVPAGPGGHGKS